MYSNNILNLQVSKSILNAPTEKSLENYRKHLVYIVSQFFSVARLPKLGSKPGWLKSQSKMLPLSYEETRTSEENLNTYVSHLFCLHISA